MSRPTAPPRHAGATIPGEAGGHAAPDRFLRRLTVALLIAAVLPLLAFGGLALLQVDAAVATTLANQVRVGLAGAVGLLERDREDLVETTVSYATWPVLQRAVAADDLTDIHTDVVSFQVDQGELDVVVVVADRAVAAGGADDAVAAITGIAATAARAAPTVGDVGPRRVALASGVYQVAAVPVVVGGRTRGAVAMARRLDAPTLVAIGQNTGFEVAVQAGPGVAPVTTDVGLLEETRTAGVPTEPEVAINAGLAIGRRGLVDATGAVVATLVVAKPLDALDAVAANLVALIATMLGAATLVAAGLAWALATRLRARAELVAAWVTGLGDRAAPPDGEHVDADLRSVSDAVGELAAALRRSEERLRRSLDAVAGLSPRLGVAAVTEIGLRSARQIFAADQVELRSGHGRSESFGADAADPEVSPGVAGDRRPGVATADVELPAAGEPSGASLVAGQLIAHGAALRDWTEFDHATFKLYGRLLGIAIRDAALVDQASERERELDHLARLQADFLRGVSHNLQQPLTTIRLVADELASEPSRDRVEDAARIVRVESARLSRLVLQLLTMSRLDAGTLQVEVEPIAVAPLVRHAWDSVRSTRRLVVDDRASGVLAIADRACLEQILLVLLDNAVRYAPRGPVGVRIEPWSAAAQGPTDPRLAAAVAITVSDEGPGIPAPERERIFERFARGSTSTGIDGTGLGLDVARGLARAMGGDLVCRERSGGACFELTLPAEPGLWPA